MQPISEPIPLTRTNHVGFCKTPNDSAFKASLLANSAKDIAITGRKVTVDNFPKSARFVIGNDRDRQTVLAALRQSPAHANNPHLLYIDSMQALDTLGLVKTITLNNGQCQIKPGHLFRQEPQTLVIDLTAMRPDDIASLNDLMDNQPSCQGQPVGSAIQRILLTNQQTTAMLGQDYRRRARRFPKADIPQLPEPVLTDNELLQARIKPFDPSSPPSANHEIVDFYLNSDWRTPLLGGLVLSGKKGGITHKAGALPRLKPGGALVLRNAPWRSDSDPGRSSSDFDKTLATILREQGFELYGQWYRLPDGITLYRYDTSTGDIENKKKDYGAELDPHAEFIRVNRGTIEFLDNPIRINEQGYPEQFNPLAEWAGTCTQIRITETLTFPQWLQFFRYFEQLESDHRPSLVMDGQKTYGDETGPIFSVIRNHPKISAYADVQEAENDWDNLFQQVSLESRCRNRYAKQNLGMSHDAPAFIEGRLLDHIKNDTNFSSRINSQLVISGIEADSNAAKKFATLNERPPYLFVHGKKVILDDSFVCNKIVLAVNDAPSTDAFFLLAKYYMFNDSRRHTFFHFKKISALFSKIITKLGAQEESPGNKPSISIDGLLFKLWKYWWKLESEESYYFALLKAAQRLVARPWRAQSNHYGFILCQLRLAFPEMVEYPRFDKDALPAWLDCASTLSSDVSGSSGYRPPSKADRDGLRHWFVQHPSPNPESLREHYWELARFCPIWAFTDLPDTLIPEPDHPCLKQLALWLVGAVEPGQQAELADHLGVAVEDCTNLHYYSGQTIKQLSRWLQLHLGDLFLAKEKKDLKSILEQLSDVVPILERSDLLPPAKIKRITPLLTRNITPDEQLPQGARDFPHALVYGYRHGYLRQQLRLNKLARDMLNLSLIFLTGGAGTGKSRLAETAATLKCKTCKDHWPSSQQLTLGPHTSREDLFGREVIKDSDNGDKHSVFEPGPVLSKERHHTLILNEANLADPGVLSKLSNLKYFHPFFWANGKEYIVANNITLTGNPDDYEGRCLDPAVTDACLQLDIPPMAPDELALGIIRPALPGQWSARLKGYVCGAMLAMLRQYQRILPEDPVNPREVKELLAIISHTLACNETGAAIGIPDTSAVNGLIIDALRLTLDHRIPPEQQAQLNALQQWSKSRFRENSALLDARERQFGFFVRRLHLKNPNIVLDVAPLMALIKQYWLTLNKGDTGRTALLVEGPAGWGKDLLLNRVLALWYEQQPERSRLPAIHLTASNSQWDYLSETVRQAAKRGQVIAISELNLINTGSLEGLLNDILTGKAAPGFRLIATVNPGSFAGRKPLSPALKNRFTQFELNPLGRNDITNVLSKLTGKHVLVSWLTLHFANLCELLATRNGDMVPAIAELVDMVAQLDHQPEIHWPLLFARYFDEELAELNMNVAELSTLPPMPVSSVTHDTNIIEMPDENEGLATLSGLPDYLINPEPYGLQDADLNWPTPGADNKQKKSDGNLLYRYGRKLINQIRPDLPVDNRKPGDNSTYRHQQIQTRPSVTGNITQHCVLENRKRFASKRYSPRDYRLGIYKLTFSRDNQRVTCDLVDPESEGVTPVTAALLSPGRCVHLHSGEVLGGERAVLDHKHWHPLPGLSPADQLTAIQCRHQPDLKLDLARSNATGQLLVRLAKGSDRQEVQLDFVIKPSDQRPPVSCSYSSEPLLDETTQQMLDSMLVNQQNRTRPGIRQRIWQDLGQYLGLLPKELPKLPEIIALPDVKEKINALADWLRSFRSNSDVEGEGRMLLLNLIAAEQGVCFHRSVIFELLARYFRVPARMVGNDGHCYVEYSPDGGQSWHKLDLGGGGDFTLQYSSEDLLDTVENVWLVTLIALIQTALNRLATYLTHYPLPNAGVIKPKPNRNPGFCNEAIHDLCGVGITEESTVSNLKGYNTQTPVAIEPANTNALTNQHMDIPEPLPGNKIQPKHQHQQVRTEDIDHWLKTVDLLLYRRRHLPPRIKRITRHHYNKQISTAFQSDPFIQTLQQTPTGKALVIKVLRLAQTLSDLPGNPVHKQLQLVNIFFDSPLRLAALFSVNADLITKAKDDLPCADILPMLEVMASYPETRLMALEHINPFYQTTFSKTCVWHLNDVPPPDTADILPSSFLDRILGRSIPATEWSPIPTGRPPSVERMITGQDAYPKSCSVQGGRNPAIIHLQGPWLKKLQRLVATEPLDKRETDEVLPRKRRRLTESSISRNQHPVDSDSFTAMLYQFLYWLGTQDHKSEWCWLVSRPTTEITGEAAAIAPGCYQTPPPLPAVEALLQSVGTGIELNPSRLIPVLNKAEGVFLTSEHMENLFNEFLDQWH